MLKAIRFYLLLKSILILISIEASATVIDTIGSERILRKGCCHCVSSFCQGDFAVCRLVEAKKRVAAA